MTRKNWTSFIFTLWTDNDVPRGLSKLPPETLYLSLGTIHKQCQQFFRTFDTPFPTCRQFLVLSVGSFDQLLTPTPSQLPTIQLGTVHSYGRSLKSRSEVNGHKYKVHLVLDRRQMILFIQDKEYYDFFLKICNFMKQSHSLRRKPS